MRHISAAMRDNQLSRSVARECAPRETARGSHIFPPNERDHAQGSAHAPVTLIEYGDFCCRRSADLFPIIRDIQTWLGGSLRFVFRHLPCDPRERDSPSVLAAEAAEAAGEQNCFWQMHDRLFEQRAPSIRDDLRRDDLIRHAEALRVDMEVFRRALKERRYTGVVLRHEVVRHVLGVTHSPALFINGETYTGALLLSPLLEAIETAHGRMTNQMSPLTENTEVSGRRRTNNEVY